MFSSLLIFKISYLPLNLYNLAIVTWLSPSWKVSNFTQISCAVSKSNTLVISQSDKALNNASLALIFNFTSLISFEVVGVPFYKALYTLLVIFSNASQMTLHPTLLEIVVHSIKSWTILLEINGGHLGSPQVIKILLGDLALIPIIHNIQANWEGGWINLHKNLQQLKPQNRSDN